MLNHTSFFKYNRQGTEGSVHLLTGVPVSRDEGGEAGHHEGGGHGVEAQAQVELRQRGAEAHYHEAGHDQQQAPAQCTPAVIISLWIYNVTPTPWQLSSPCPGVSS